MLFSGLRGISSSLVPAWTLSWLAVPTIFPVTLEEERTRPHFQWCWWLFLLDLSETQQGAMDNTEMISCKMNYLTSFSDPGVWFVIWRRFACCACKYTHYIQSNCNFKVTLRSTASSVFTLYILRNQDQTSSVMNIWWQQLSDLIE